MKAIVYCRRTFIAAMGLGALTLFGVMKNTDVSMAIASVCVGLAGANAYERSVVTGRYKE